MHNLLEKIARIVREDLSMEGDKTKETFIEILQEEYSIEPVLLNNKKYSELKYYYYYTVLRNEKYYIIDGVRSFANQGNSKKKVAIFLENVLASIIILHNENRYWLSNQLDINREPNEINPDHEMVLYKIYEEVNNTLEEIEKFFNDNYSYYLIKPKVEFSPSEMLNNEISYLDEFISGKFRDFTGKAYLFSKSSQNPLLTYEKRKELVSQEIIEYSNSKLEEITLRIISAMKLTLLHLSAENKKDSMQSFYQSVLRAIESNQKYIDNSQLQDEGGPLSNQEIGIRMCIKECLNKIESEILIYSPDLANTQQPIGNGVTRNLKAERIKSKYNVPQLGYLFTLFHEQGVMQFSSKTKATDFAAVHFSSDKKQSISPKQTRKKSYDLSIKDLQELDDLFLTLHNETFKILQAKKKI
jgi:hypothetical protein